MNIDLDRLTEAELVDLNRRVVERLRLLRQIAAHRQMLEFRVGDKVAFDPPGRGTLFGTLVRYNRKTVTVIADGGWWTCRPRQYRSKSRSGRGIACAVVPSAARGLLLRYREKQVPRCARDDKSACGCRNVGPSHRCAWPPSARIADRRCHPERSEGSAVAEVTEKQVPR